ncbi:MAG: DUF3098 domain-containing protein [Bacteroidota bacterium]|jgi:uncharacterized membrane protein
MSKLNFPFTKTNAYIILVGVAIITIGYILMSGGGSEDPNQFNPDELFSARRITVAPIVVLIGYAVIGYGIMFKSKNNENSKA